MFSPSGLFSRWNIPKIPYIPKADQLAVSGRSARADPDARKNIVYIKPVIRPDPMGVTPR
jgi:hypothetical protein